MILIGFELAMESSIAHQKRPLRRNLPPPSPLLKPILLLLRRHHHPLLRGHKLLDQHMLSDNSIKLILPLAHRALLDTQERHHSNHGRKCAKSLRLGQMLSVAFKR
jgi:hypothetical protein